MDSLESDRHHLLSPSRPASIITTNTDVTLTERPSQDTLRPSSESQRSRSNSTNLISVPYKGYPSKDAYMKALLEFAQSRQYFETDHQLIGFYGRKTMEDYLKEEGGGFRSKSKQQRKEESDKKIVEKERRRSEVERRRASLVVMDGDDGGELVDGERMAEGTKGMRRLSRGLGRVFTKKGSVG